jgi:O-antigen/teichoic acid export membrane protein
VTTAETQTEDRTFTGVPLTFATTIVIAVAYLAAGIAIARALGPSGRGQLAAVVLWATLSVEVGLLGAHEATVYVTAKYPRLRVVLRRYVGSILGFQAVVGVGVFALVAWWRSGETGLPVAAVVVFSLWVGCTSLWPRGAGTRRGCRAFGPTTPFAS